MRALTAAPETRGAPTLSASPSPSASTWSSTSSVPTSAGSFSTLIFSPALTRYCLPPVLMTAYMNIRSSRKKHEIIHVLSGCGQRQLWYPRSGRAPLPGAIPVHIAASPPSQLDAIRLVISDDMQAVDAIIRRRLDSDVLLIRRIAEY